LDEYGTIIYYETVHSIHGIRLQALFIQERSKKRQTPTTATTPPTNNKNSADASAKILTLQHDRPLRVLFGIMRRYDSIIERMAIPVGSPDNGADYVKEWTELAKNRSTLGFNPYLDREFEYAESPILARMNSLVLHGGDIRVAYVPSGHGKTTACRAYLRTLDPPFGIAFCGDREDSPSYAASMLKQLGVRDDAVPEGWMVYLLAALEASNATDTPAAQNAASSAVAAASTTRFPVLILDDCVTMV
jgi:hypothetical protein